MSDADKSQRQTYRRRHRLAGKRQFDVVFAARCRKHAGPLTVLQRPNGLPYSRLGLVVPRRAGNAVTRHRLKRLLREAFRLDRQGHPASYDIVVLVRPHNVRDLETYRCLLTDAIQQGHRVWQRRERT